MRLDKIWLFPLVWDYDHCVREAFDIGEDGTGKHRNCAIDFIRLWVLFMFLLILYFRILDDIAKTSSLFSRPCSTSLWSARLFLLSTDFLAQFWHDKISCSHSTHTWLNVKHHPPMVDQISHVSHLDEVCSEILVYYMSDCKPPGSSSLAVITWISFVTSPCNINKQRSEFRINFNCASPTFGH